MKAWAQNGEVRGVAESLGACKVAVEVDPLLPKGGLGKSEGCEPLWVRTRLCPDEEVAEPEGHTHPGSRPHSLQAETLGEERQRN